MKVNTAIEPLMTNVRDTRMFPESGGSEFNSHRQLLWPTDDSCAASRRPTSSPTWRIQETVSRCSYSAAFGLPSTARRGGSPVACQDASSSMSPPRIAQILESIDDLLLRVSSPGSMVTCERVAQDADAHGSMQA